MKKHRHGKSSSSYRRRSAPAWAFLTDREAADSLGRETGRESASGVKEEKEKKVFVYLFIYLFNFSFLFFYLKPSVKFSFESI